MIEVDGPPRAYFEGADGTRYVYKTYAISGKDPVAVMQAFATWKDEYTLQGPLEEILVWRRRPEFTTHQLDDGREIWKATCRCVKIPFVMTWTMEEKPEGAQILEIE